MIQSRYKNCIGTTIKLKLQNNTYIILKKDETSVEVTQRIDTVHKKISVITIDGDTTRWKAVDFELDDQNGIYEQIDVRNIGLHSVSSLI